MPLTRLTAADRPTLDEAVTALRAAIERHADLPPAAGSLPAGSLSLDGLSERPVGIGHLRGQAAFGTLAAVSLKGGRLDARLRFELWADGPAAAQSAVDTLQERLRMAQDDLRADGFLKLELAATGAAEPVSTGLLNTSWRQSTTYRALYEYHYADTAGATGLITRVGVASETDAGPPSLETFEVVGATVRWDNERTPALRLRGPARLTRLAALVYFPGATPSGSVTVTSSFAEAAGLATETVPIADFLAAFTPSGDQVVLGDWEATLDPPVPDTGDDSYEIRLLDLTPALILPSRADFLEIIYQPAPFDEIAALYLRGEGSS